MRLTDRLARLEQRQRPAPGPCVFESEQAAQAAGCPGGWLHIGPVMEPEEWAAAAQVQQAELCRVVSDGKH